MDTQKLKLAARVLIDAMIEELDEDDRLYEKGFADGYIASPSAGLQTTVTHLC
ncbi:hypothetical protein [Pseudomonas fluorescens]|uniref:Uncharacterized protein n=1 Tax=Pseudomonas fluorescens TaxID=294 RepID=A0A5E7F800_PSEFL|nr:hypothetical protein [Pseudomonas fluorescens]VVO33703.1 hypothetical protein PS723_05203 [Pseudomonas fluorescens]